MTTPLAIVYRQWSLAKGWTSPVEIIQLPPGFGDAQVHGAFLDKAGTMHMVFWGGDPVTAYIFYSSAPVSNIDSASAWSLPVLLGGDAFYPSSAAIAGDDQGNIFIIYNGKRDPNSIYAVHSSDSGKTWSSPTPIFLSYDFQLVPLALQLYMTSSGHLFAVWNVVTYVGLDVALYYADYDSTSAQWNEPVLLDKRIEDESYFGPSFPSITGNDGKTVILYNTGNFAPNGFVDLGRPIEMVRMTYDDGQTWSDFVVPFPQHLGRSGEHTLAVDSAGVIHAVFIMRIDDFTPEGQYAPVLGMWHSELRGDAWSNPERYVPNVQPHDVRSVVAQGNILLLLWRQDPGGGQSGIWYTYLTLDAPELPKVALPVEDGSNDSSIVPTSTPASNPIPIYTNTPADFGNIGPRIFSNPATPLFFGVILTILLFAGIIIVVYRSSRSK